MTRDEAADLEKLVDASKETNLEVAPVILKKGVKRFQLRRPGSDLVLTVLSLDGVLAYSREAKKKKNLCIQGGRRESGPVAYSKEPPKIQPSGLEDVEEGEEMGKETLMSLEREPRAVDDPGQDGKPKVSVEFFLRSPETLLYYLGELIRVEELQGLVPEVCVQNEYEPIFVVRGPGLGCTTGIVATEFDESSYFIPRNSRKRSRNEGDGAGQKREQETCVPHGEPGKPSYTSRLACASGRSMQALSLLNQLIALHKSAKDLPTTNLVRTIGQ